MIILLNYLSLKFNIKNNIHVCFIQSILSQNVKYTLCLRSVTHLKYPKDRNIFSPLVALSSVLILDLLVLSTRRFVSPWTHFVSWNQTENMWYLKQWRMLLANFSHPDQIFKLIKIKIALSLLPYFPALNL